MPVEGPDGLPTCLQGTSQGRAGLGVWTCETSGLSVDRWLAAVLLQDSRKPRSSEPTDRHHMWFQILRL